MTIGEALKEEQKRLGLTSEAMAAGVITKGTYSKVVNGKQRLSSDLLVEILFKHDIDVSDFFEMIKSTYMSKEKFEEEILTKKFKLALDNHEIQKAKKIALKLRNTSNNPYLLWQFQIALAYLEHTENKLTIEFKNKIVNEINQTDNWTENIDVLRLFTNSIKESAIIHAIDECVGSYKGLLFEAFHGRINYSELNSRAVAKHIIKTKVSTTFSNSISNLNLEELMKNTETFFAIINSQCGYTVKAFSTKLQPETLVDTTPLTSRLLLRTNRPLIKGCMPFW